MVLRDFNGGGGTLSPMLRRLIALTLLVPAARVAAEKATLALVGGQVIDGYEGAPIHDGVVLIAGDRIVAVGPRGEVTVPPGTTIIDTEGHERPARPHGHARPPHAARPRRLRALGQDVHEPIPRRDHAARREAAPDGRGHDRPRPRRSARGQHRDQATDRGGRDPGPAPLRLGALHPEEGLLRLRDDVPLGRERGGGRAGQGPEADRRGGRRHQADRPGPAHRGRGEDGGGDRPQGGEARGRARPPRGRDPGRAQARRRLLRAHRPRHRARLPGGRAGGTAQAEPDALLVPHHRPALPGRVHGAGLPGAARRSFLVSATSRRRSPRTSAPPCAT